MEIATDKVDSEVPSEVDGVLVEKLFEADDVVQVGQTIAIIEIEGEVQMQMVLKLPERRELMNRRLNLEVPADPEVIAEVESRVASAEAKASTNCAYWKAAGNDSILAAGKKYSG